jgi:hypothetical protein
LHISFRSNHVGAINIIQLRENGVEAHSYSGVVIRHNFDDCYNFLVSKAAPKKMHLVFYLNKIFAFNYKFILLRIYADAWELNFNFPLVICGKNECMLLFNFFKALKNV